VSVGNESNGIYRNVDIFPTKKEYMSHIGSSSIEDFNGEYDITLSKLNKSGNIIFEREIDIENEGYIASHIQLPNEDFIILSSILNPKTYNIHRITEEGDKIFSKSSQKDLDDNIFGSVMLSSEDSTILFLNGFTDFGKSTVKVSKMDFNGNIKMAKDLLTNVNQAGCKLISLSDGNLLFCCSIESKVKGRYHMRIIKLNADFGVIWDKEYFDLESNYITDVIESNDNSLLILSHSGSIGAGQFDIILSQLNSEGIIEKRSVMGSEILETGRKLYQKQNGNIVIVGYQNNLEDIKPSWLFTLETDSTGVPL
jgi:hypothetical protein